MSTALHDVIKERCRQINEEGFTAERDDGYRMGELAGAAACYALNAARPRSDQVKNAVALAVHDFWPWAAYWWKPTDQRRDLVKAAALIIAEIERLDRAT